ncbi:MAG: chromosome segregation protein SMC [Streptococcaceae bacterium]|jgi:chromosome segregation protein|nr:chromosome segregation protein SMC [Streptococcaceae bacterium]
MYLKKLELQGFKSFADKTAIAFDQGITAVVGPNGSGKSNITEGLRWVMGEQSAKSLRGGKMPDVIFSGTAKRKAMNYAEVTAHFDNSDGYLDGEAELIVTRRLYRNGDSDYLINGKKKRLKDIHGLFMDSGTGRDSLSIISQGRIEGIFNAKPEDRRAIFEEAAGVNKYKNSKLETESKLKHTQENLDRLEDIIYELSGQLTPLRAQREAALKFQELDGERAEMALAVLVAQIDAGLAARTEGQKELKQVSGELEALLTSQSGFEKELADLREKRVEAETALETLSAEILTLSDLKAGLERRLAVAEEQAKSAEKSAGERSERLSNLTEERQGLEEELSNLTERLTVLDKEVAEADEQVATLAQELSDFDESPETVTERLQEEYLALVQREAELSNLMTRAQAEMEAIQERASAEDSEAAANQEKLVLAKSQQQAAEEEVANLSQAIDALVADFQAQDAQNHALSGEVDAAQNAQFAAMEALQKLEAQLASLERIRENHSNLYAGVRAVMQNTKLSGMIGVVGDLIRFDSQYATALDVALGAGAQNIITENENDARQAIAYLRDQRLGRATFLPLTTIKARDFRDYNRVKSQPGFIDLAVNLVKFDSHLENAISSLLGTTLIVDNGDHASAIARNMGFNVRIVTLDGTQINPGGSYAGGSRGKNSTTFTTAEIENLQNQIVQAKAELSELEQQSQELSKKQTALAASLIALREEGEQKRLSEKEAELKRDNLRQTVKDLEELLALSAGHEDSERLKTLAAENEATNQELAVISEKKETLNEELDRVRSNASEITALKAQKQSDWTAAKVAQTEAKSERDHAAMEQARLTEALTQLSSEIEALSNLTATTEVHVESQTNLAAQLEEATSKLTASQVRQVSLRMERDDLSAQLEDLETHNASSLTERETLTTQKTRLELQLEQLEQQLRTYQQRLSEEHQLSYEAARTKLTHPQTSENSENPNTDESRFDSASAQKATPASAAPQSTVQATQEFTTEADTHTSKLISPENLPNAEKTLRDLERQIRALGPVNLEAVAQFDEVNARYELYTSQKADLDAAKSLLLTNINSMDDEVRKRFETAFTAIRESFQLTFRQMFAGGEADLELTTEDFLTAGIEINVQPPGKKLASLSLMSGGEKALTALALLFAILRVRTVPFVVLDEVEAALDEANVKRFGDYMNNFDSSNQFIVVTHRKGTMKAARVLYGVTMLDAGVSKIVSVKFDDVPDDVETSQEVTVKS